MEHPERLILLVRCPEAGRVKTRLARELGDAGALAAHRALGSAVLGRVTALRATRPVDFEIRYAGDDPAGLRAWLGDAGAYRPQSAGDLGARMAEALATACTEGARRVLLIGGDCPAITPALLAEAFDALASHDLVIGPATDGGYYLIGSTAPRPALFAPMAWGTDVVRAETAARAAALGLRVHHLAPCSDIDEPADYRRFLDESKA